MKTLLLDQSAWDLVLDANSNIALAAEPYALAQDAASAMRAFQGEVYYDTSQGVPYFQQILGRLPPTQLMKAAFVKAALTVPGVVTAVCFLKALTNRNLVGQVQITDSQGATLAVAAAPIPIVPGGSQFGQLDFTNPDNAIFTTV